MIGISAAASGLLVNGICHAFIALIPSTATTAAAGQEHNIESTEVVSDESIIIPLQDQQTLCSVCKQQAGIVSNADLLSNAPENKRR